MFIAGGANSAGQAAVNLARPARQFTVLVRRDSIAETMSRYLIDEIAGTPNIDVRHNTEVIGGHGESRLESLTLRDTRAGTTETVPASVLFVLIGAEPHTDWLPEDIQRDEHGYVLTGTDLRGVKPVPGRWIGRRWRSRQASPVSSPPAMSAIARSSVSRRPLAKDRSRRRR